ncbi:hypothetical protein V8C86DRAFT_3108724 [Haematococcus lacustris]
MAATSPDDPNALGSDAKRKGAPMEQKDIAKKMVLFVRVQRISKVLSDGGKITHALHMAQQAKYNAIRHVASHCPTRFAILYKICVDIERSEDAFRMMVESGDWVHVAASCANSDDHPLPQDIRINIFA